MDYLHTVLITELVDISIILLKSSNCEHAKTTLKKQVF